MISEAVRLSLLIFTLSYSLMVSAASVVPLKIYSQDEELASGLATKVSDDVFLASYKLINHGSRWAVINEKTGALLIGEVIAEDKATDLILLKVKGTDADIQDLALEGASIGRLVSVPTLSGGRIDGVISNFDKRQLKNGVIHTALYSKEVLGAPLLNNCGEMIGLNQTAESGFLSRTIEIPDPVIATGYSSIKGFLENNSVSYSISKSRCLSAAEKLTRHEEELNKKKIELDNLKAKANKTPGQLKKLNEKVLELEKQKKAAEMEKLRLDDEKIKSDKAHEKLKKKQQEIKKKNSELKLQQEKLEDNVKLEKQRKKYLIYGSATSFILLLLFSVIMLRKRKEALIKEEQHSSKIKNELDKATETYPDIILAGEDFEGKKLRIKINGAALIQSEVGQIIGRDAAVSDYVIYISEVSRKHILLKVMDQGLYVTDLSSANGTAVNGKKLVSGEPCLVKTGDRLTLSTIDFELIEAT